MRDILDRTGAVASILYDSETSPFSSSRIPLVCKDGHGTA